MNLFFYLQTFILNYSFIVILSDHIFVLCFIKTQSFVKRKPVKTEKKYRNDRIPFQAGFTVLDFYWVYRPSTVIQNKVRKGLEFCTKNSFSRVALDYLKLLFTLRINLDVGLFVYMSIHAYTYGESVCVSKTLVSDPRSMTELSICCHFQIYLPAIKRPNK